MPGDRSPFLRVHLPALAWAVWSAYLFLQPGSEEIGRTGGPMHWILSQSSYWKDIAAHIVFFGILGWLAYRSVRRLGTARPLLTTAVTTAVYGMLLELAQRYVPGRAVEPWDVLANAAGAALAAWGAHWWYGRETVVGDRDPSTRSARSG